MLPRLAFSSLTLAILSAAAMFAVPPPRPWAPNPFTPLSPDRIAALPNPPRDAWQRYWHASEQLAAQLPVRPKADASSLKPMSTPPIGGVHSKGLRLGEPAAWYASDDAHTVADRIVAAQIAVGAWMKGVDYTRDIDAQSSREKAPTFDNNATIFELRFLAQVIAASPAHPHAADWRAAFERGLRYVFAAQYPNGGFPQMYPLVGGYHDGITFNDDAMTQVLELLRDIARADQPYAIVAPALREQAAARFQLGLDCILATQLRDANGQLTVWCQQYDPLTLRAAAARSFEPVADASRESANITHLLMSVPNPSPEIVAAVEAAAAWFRTTALHDLKIARAPADLRGGVVPSPGAPLLWARFYEPGTSTPIFGDRDRMVHYDLSNVSSERVAGYAWYTQSPARVLDKLDAWRKKIPSAPAPSPPAS